MTRPQRKNMKKITHYTSHDVIIQKYNKKITIQTKYTKKIYNKHKKLHIKIFIYPHYHWFEKHVYFYHFFSNQQNY